MTKENIYKSYLEDPLLVQKKHISQDMVANLTFIKPTNVKLLEIIKIAISGIIDGESETVVARKINQNLNK